MKKVLGIVASHRKLGNAEMAVKEVMASVPVECSKELIRLTDLNLAYCKACYSCLPTGVACHIKDDLGFLLAKIQEADAVVIGAPVYFLGLHGAIKLLQDRLLSVSAEQLAFSGKRCVTITTYGVNGWEGYGQAELNLTAHVLHLDLVDSLLFHGANPGEIWLNPANREKAQQAGRGLLDPVYQAKQATNICPHCWSDIFRVKPGGQIVCAICGLEGNMGENGNIIFGSTQHGRFTPQSKTEHFENWLQMKKKEFIANKPKFKELQKPYVEMDWWVQPPGKETD